MSFCFYRPCWQVVWLDVLHTRKHTRCAPHTQTHSHMSADTTYILMLLCQITLSAYQSSLQSEAAVESVAMKSRYDPSDCWSQHESGQWSGREREGTGWHCKKEQTEPSTNSNVNCSGLHNLRLMRKHRQIKSPSLYPSWISSTGRFSLKRHQKQYFNDLWIHQRFNSFHITSSTCRRECISFSKRCWVLFSSGISVKQTWSNISTAFTNCILLLPSNNAHIVRLV